MMADSFREEFSTRGVLSALACAQCGRRFEPEETLRCSPEAEGCDFVLCPPCFDGFPAKRQGELGLAARAARALANDIVASNLRWFLLVELDVDLEEGEERVICMRSERRPLAERPQPRCSGLWVSTTRGQLPTPADAAFD